MHATKQNNALLQKLVLNGSFMPSNFPSSYKWHSLYFKTCDRMINICVNVNVSIYHKSPLHTKGFPSIMLCRSIFIFHTYKKITRFCHYLHTCEKSKCVIFHFQPKFSLSFRHFILMRQYELFLSL